MNQQHPTLPAPRSPKTARSTDRGVFATRRPSLQAGPQTYRIATHVASDSASTVELKDHADAPRAAWDGYERDVLPRKLQPKVLRNLRNQLLSLYRRLFGLVFVANLGLFGRRAGARRRHVAAPRADHHREPLLRDTPQERATREVMQGGEAKASVAAVAISYCILLLLLGIVVFAYPSMRSKRHDSFERSHRFLGWTGIALVWAQVVILTNDYTPRTQSLPDALIHAPPFWLLVVMTGSVILPWLRLRKVAVRSEVLSKHAVRLHFSYNTPKPGATIRLADHPLKDWHGFATIPGEFSYSGPVPNEQGSSVVVSRAGDWTATQITQPPSAMWVRGAPTFGVLRILPLFRRVLLVATGSGIGPCASCVKLIQERRVPVRLLWTSPDVRETFGDRLVEEVSRGFPDSIIYDTKKQGRPDMVKLTLRLASDFNAEAVCIISNQKLTQKIVYGCVSRGIPAFGPIWDS
ncbi:hypothetical protein C8J57DRAFT_1509039 [Mycena rebaudengoi]|nr:hypothetical protein C8J57DRAFT_1509039 [Mycena rebaudengoi]